jgi:hypothetical protein
MIYEYKLIKMFNKNLWWIQERNLITKQNYYHLISQLKENNSINDNSFMRTLEWTKINLPELLI